jgi:hypothetical protein
MEQQILRSLPSGNNYSSLKNSPPARAVLIFPRSLFAVMHGGPDSSKRTDDAEQNAPRAESITVVEKTSDTSTDNAPYSDSDPDK